MFNIVPTKLIYFITAHKGYIGNVYRNPRSIASCSVLILFTNGGDVKFEVTEHACKIKK